MWWFLWKFHCSRQLTALISKKEGSVSTQSTGGGHNPPYCAVWRVLCVHRTVHTVPSYKQWWVDGRFFDSFPRAMPSDHKSRLLLVAQHWSRVLFEKDPQKPLIPKELPPIIVEYASMLFDSLLLTHKEKSLLFDVIASKVKPNPKCQLLFRASKDGFGAKDFHAKCDDKGSTVTIALSKKYGHVFGGYTAQSWKGEGVRLRIHACTCMYTWKW